MKPRIQPQNSKIFRLGLFDFWNRKYDPICLIPSLVVTQIKEDGPLRINRTVSNEFVSEL